MKIKRILLSLLSLTMLALMVSNLNAQVSVGSLEKPSSGALLQLKNIDGVTNGDTNANKGLGMPRVMLTSITDLYPMFPAGYKKDVHDLVHTGLIVYNVNENLFNGDGIGLYVWDGTKWMGAGLTARGIFASSTALYLSEIKPTLNVSLTTEPEDLSWSSTTSNNFNSSSYTSKDSKNNLVFRKGDGVYGNKTYTFTLDNSDRHVDIEVAHLNLTLNKTLFKVGENGTVSSSSTVVAVGGDEDWIVKDYTRDVFNWTVAPHNEGGSLSFALGSTTQSGTVVGTITVAHINEPELTKVITIQQNKDYILLPEFDYLVVQYVYTIGTLPSGVDRIDLDTATEFNGTGVSTVDQRPVGWALKSTIAADGKSFLYWPGDNVKSGYESVYANMTILKDQILPETAAREFNVDMYATWFYPTADQMLGNDEITIHITLYRGGVMEVLNTYDYKNVGGAKVFELNKSGMRVTSYKGVESFRSAYTKMLRLEYDRIDNTGVLTPLRSIQRMAPASDNMPVMLPTESKDEYVKRLEEYRRQTDNE